MVKERDDADLRVRGQARLALGALDALHERLCRRIGVEEVVKARRKDELVADAAKRGALDVVQAQLGIANLLRCKVARNNNFSRNGSTALAISSITELDVGVRLHPAAWLTRLRMGVGIRGSEAGAGVADSLPSAPADEAGLSFL